nr:MAG TPA: hypothetical protein [Caudoviricetes sp.]
MSTQKSCAKNTLCKRIETLEPCSQNVKSLAVLGIL